MIHVNGKTEPFTEQTTVLDYLNKNQYQAERIAVELNGSIVPRAAYGSSLLQDQDRLEIVCFVGGG